MGTGNSGAGYSGNAAQRAVSLDTQGEHMNVVKELNDPSYEDGTYDITTKAVVEYPNGYQVTFWQIGDDYTPAEYVDKVREFLKYSSDGKTLAGKYGGSPEISFHVMNKRTAIRLAKKYNQVSVWDWDNCNEIKTGGTGKRRKNNG